MKLRVRVPDAERCEAEPREGAPGITEAFLVETDKPIDVCRNCRYE